jgi:UDP:flavonoid glycosyltransferase YjiC (YdhE family)
LDKFLEAGDPPVYFTFGSMMPISLEYIRETAAIWSEAVQQVGCRAILQIPWQDPFVFPSSEQTFTVQRSPYKKVFPRCSLVVHHGGAGTTQSALLTGRPAIIVAHVSDQFFWGAELERLGVAGKTLNRKGLKPSQENWPRVLPKCRRIQGWHRPPLSWGNAWPRKTALRQRST